MTKREAQSLYLEFLRAEGYRPEVDEDADLVVKVDGRVYLLLLDDDDPEYVRLYFPNFWSLETPGERRVALEAAENATRRTKVAKVFLSKKGEDVSAAFEMLASPDCFTAVFGRAIRILQTAVGHFVSHMREATPPSVPVGRA